MITIDLTSSTVVVTGAGGGLGAAIVQRFADAGAAVVAHGRRGSAGLDRLASLPRVQVVLGDLEDESFVAELFTDQAPWGPANVLVNNAGTYPVTPLLETATADFESVLRGNAAITFACLREAAASMKEAGGGSIVNIASLNAHRPSGKQVAYDSAKGAVVTLTRAAAAELAPHGIRVNSVSPGLLDRPGLRTEWPEGVAAWLAACPSGRLGRPEDVADACVFLASPLASWITGQDLCVDGGITAAPVY